MSNTILLVDDDKEFREEFKECFDEYNVLEAGNGREGIDILRKPNEIDIVILDIRMPGLNGIDVLKEMKAIDPSLGIIIMTGFGSKDVVVEALRHQSNDYIEKPMAVDKTRKIIEKVLDLSEKNEYKDTGSANSKIEKVKKYLERNYNKKVTLNDAAAIVFLNPKYLSRVFKQNTGVEFKEFVLKLKIEKAKELLNKSDFSVEQMSYKLGYQNSESFIRIFKNITGKTPSEFRGKKKKKLSKTRNPKTTFSRKAGHLRKNNIKSKSRKK